MGDLLVCRVCAAKQRSDDYAANGNTCVACGRNPVTAVDDPAYAAAQANYHTPVAPFENYELPLGES